MIKIQIMLTQQWNKLLYAFKPTISCLFHFRNFYRLTDSLRSTKSSLFITIFLQILCPVSNSAVMKEFCFSKYSVEYSPKMYLNPHTMKSSGKAKIKINESIFFRKTNLTCDISKKHAFTCRNNIAYVCPDVLGINFTYNAYHTCL